jgi:DNA-binding CsgD family transcriptional regulator
MEDDPERLPRSEHRHAQVVGPAPRPDRICPLGKRGGPGGARRRRGLGGAERNSLADRSLYAAIRWAEDLGKDFIPRRGSLPVVLDAGEGSPAKVWWVIGDAGTILFSLGGPGREARQLEAAGVVFRLSAAQKAVTAHVIAGRRLEEIAKLMGIKESSARTHLDRVFEKSGVRTQGALIRVLLSIAAPV